MSGYCGECGNTMCVCNDSISAEARNDYIRELELKIIDLKKALWSKELAIEFCERLTIDMVRNGVKPDHYKQAEYFLQSYRKKKQ